MGVAKVPSHDHLQQSPRTRPQSPRGHPTNAHPRPASLAKTQRRTARVWSSALNVAPRMARMGVVKVPPRDHLHQSPIARPPETGVCDS